MSILVATDLDRTLIYSRSAMGEHQFNTVAPQCVEIYDGAPLSYMSARAIGLLTRLASTATVVPVTTRTHAQFSRVTLPGAPLRYAVVSSGGRIIVDGADDAGWRSGIEDAVRGLGADLQTVTTQLRERTDDGWVRSLRVADDLFCYLVVDLERQPAGFLDEWRGWCEPRGWAVSQQGRKIYAMPQCVTKSAAVAEVRRRLSDTSELPSDAPLLAAGDGWLDADLLTYADAAIRPRHGELEVLGWHRPHLVVTEQQGALAGEEILQWFIDQANRSDPIERTSAYDPAQ